MLANSKREILKASYVWSDTLSIILLCEGGCFHYKAHVRSLFGASWDVAPPFAFWPLWRARSLLRATSVRGVPADVSSESTRPLTKVP